MLKTTVKVAFASSIVIKIRKTVYFSKCILNSEHFTIVCGRIRVYSDIYNGHVSTN